MSAAPCNTCRRATNRTPCPICAAELCDGCRIAGKAQCCEGSEWSREQYEDPGETIEMSIDRITPKMITVGDGYGYEERVPIATFLREWKRVPDEDEEDPGFDDPIETYVPTTEEVASFARSFEASSITIAEMHAEKYPALVRRARDDAARALTKEPPPHAGECWPGAREALGIADDPNLRDVYLEAFARAVDVVTP